MCTLPVSLQVHVLWQAPECLFIDLLGLEFIVPQVQVLEMVE